MDILICDDNASVRKSLKEKLLEYQFMRDVDYRIKEYSSGEDLLKEEYTETAILFLDIEMKGINGIETAEEIRKINPHIIIVFLTAYKEYVFEGYKVNAFRYLLKPIKMEELVETLDSVEKNLKSGEDMLLLSFGKDEYRILVSEISFIEIEGRKITVHCGASVYRSVGTLEELEGKLKSRSFFRVHKSYIVNIEKIKKFDNQNIYFKDEKSVPISRLKLQEFKKAYLDCWKEMV